jgi:hypothetical protein
MWPARSRCRRLSYDSKSRQAATTMKISKATPRIGEA